jgi:hypothetical protein
VSHKAALELKGTQMEITKTTVVDQITVTESGCVLVRQATRVLEGAAVLSETYHRLSFFPGQDVSGQPENVRAICATVWTPEVVATYQESLLQST